jgi:carbohydrate diacid regulator
MPWPRCAETIVNRAAELFRSQVLLLNADGVIVVSSKPGVEGIAFELLEGKELRAAFRIPCLLQDTPAELVVSEIPDEEIISPRLAQVLVELMIDEILNDQHPPDERELKNRFIHDLVHGAIEDEATIIHNAELLGLDLTPPRAVILLDASTYILGNNDGDRSGANGQAQRRAQYIVDTIINFFHLPNDLICAYLGNGEVGVLKASDSQNLAAWADSPSSTSSWADLAALKRAADALLARLPNGSGKHISIGIGRYHPGLNGLCHSYADARMALSLGRRFHQDKRIHCLDELGIAAFVGLSDEQTKVELAAHLLSPLDDEPELLETLTTFFAEDCCSSVSASHLSIHRNTLSYRLDKVTSLTGLDPRCFDDAVQIRLALLLRNLTNQPHS